MSRVNSISPWLYFVLAAVLIFIAFALLTRYQLGINPFVNKDNSAHDISIIGMKEFNNNPIDKSDPAIIISTSIKTAQPNTTNSPTKPKTTGIAKKTGSANRGDKSKNTSSPSRTSNDSEGNMATPVTDTKLQIIKPISPVKRPKPVLPSVVTPQINVPQIAVPQTPVITPVISAESITIAPHEIKVPAVKTPVGTLSIDVQL